MTNDQILVRSPSGASATCLYCGTIYDLHGLDITDLVPPVGDGCQYCCDLDDDEDASPDFPA